MKKSTLKVITVLLLVFIGIHNQMPAQSLRSRKPTNNTELKFRTFHYIDKQGMRIEAFHVLIPDGWKFEGGIDWHLNNPGMPAVLSFKVRNPKDHEEFEVFPDQSFFWTNNQMFFESFPPGSLYYGNEVRKPVSAVHALENIVLPKYRANVANLKILNVQELPKLAQRVAANEKQTPNISSSADAAKIRIEYLENGVWMDEDIYGVVEQSKFSTTSIYSTNILDKWELDYLFSFKAEKGKLDSQSKLFQTIAYSFKLDPQWFNKYYHLIGILSEMRIRQIQTIGEISNIVSRTSDQISNTVMNSYNFQQTINDKIINNFCKSIRGVYKYYNPMEGKSIELPEGYKKVWADDLGEYILSDNPNYNPNNNDSNLNWKQISKE